MKQENESKVFTELRRIRDEMIAEEKRVGSDKFWADVHQRGREHARKHGLKYVKSPSSAYVLHELPEGLKRRGGKRKSG